jgi:hypothetical protein
VVNIRIKMASIPFVGFPKEYVISFLNLFTTIFWIRLGVDDFFHTVLKINPIGINTVIHARDNVLEDGSKIENRLVIIFIFCLVFLLVWMRCIFLFLFLMKGLF